MFFIDKWYQTVAYFLQPCFFKRKALFVQWWTGHGMEQTCFVATDLNIYNELQAKLNLMAVLYEIYCLCSLFMFWFIVSTFRWTWFTWCICWIGSWRNCIDNFVTSWIKLLITYASCVKYIFFQHFLLFFSNVITWSTSYHPLSHLQPPHE